MKKLDRTLKIINEAISLEFSQFIKNILDSSKKQKNGKPTNSIPKTVHVFETLFSQCLLVAQNFVFLHSCIKYIQKTEKSKNNLILLNFELSLSQFAEKFMNEIVSVLEKYLYFEIKKTNKPISNFSTPRVKNSTKLFRFTENEKLTAGYRSKQENQVIQKSHENIPELKINDIIHILPKLDEFTQKIRSIIDDEDSKKKITFEDFVIGKLVPNSEEYTKQLLQSFLQDPNALETVGLGTKKIFKVVKESVDLIYNIEKIYYFLKVENIEALFHIINEVQELMFKKYKLNVIGQNEIVENTYISLNLIKNEDLRTFVFSNKLKNFDSKSSESFNNYNNKEISVIFDHKQQTTDSSQKILTLSKLKLLSEFHSSSKYFITNIKESMILKKTSQEATIKTQQLLFSSLRNLEKFSSDCLFALRIECKYRCLYFIHESVSKNNYYISHTKTTTNDSFIKEMCSEIASIKNNASEFLEDGTIQFLFDGLDAFVSSAFINNISNIKLMNSKGKELLLLNTQTIKQCLEVNKLQSSGLDYFESYLNLYEINLDKFSQRVEDNHINYGYKPYKMMLDLILETMLHESSSKINIQSTEDIVQTYHEELVMLQELENFE